MDSTILFENFQVRKKLLIFLKQDSLFKDIIQRTSARSLLFCLLIYPMLILLNITLYRYVLTTQKVFRRMAKPGWQHKRPFNLPNFRTLKLRMSFMLDIVFLLEFFQLIALYRTILLCRWPILQDENDFYILKGGEFLTEHHMSFRPKGETRFK